MDTLPNLAGLTQRQARDIVEPLNLYLKVLESQDADAHLGLNDADDHRIVAEHYNMTPAGTAIKDLPSYSVGILLK